MSSAFRDVFVYHDEDSGQSFIVNARLLSKQVDLYTQFHDNLETRPWSSFISLKSPLVLVCVLVFNVQTTRSDMARQTAEIPESVLQILQEIRHQSLDGGLLVSLGRKLRVEDAVPLAAILLEYPVAYVPTSPDTSFLSGEVLTVFECYLEQEATSTPFRHTLIKFSCPESTTRSSEHMSSGSLTIRLIERFAPRIRKMDGSISLRVRISREMLDRVAL